MRLIDADALKEAITQNREIDRNAVCDVLDIIDDAPTVEPQKIVTIPPELIEKLASCVVDTIGNIDWEKAIEAYKARPKGKWIPQTDYDGFTYWKCSKCGKKNDYEVTDFCFRCGADMRGERQ